MSRPGGEAHEFRQIARYEVRSGALEKSLAAIRKFVDYVRASEPEMLCQEVWQAKNAPTQSSTSSSPRR